MNQHNMEYNSQKDNLIISEYGRHIQNLIDYARGVEESDQRQLVTERIIYLMHQINPKSRNFLDQKEKLWRHVFKIAKYDLNVETPDGKVPTEDDSKLNPDPLAYPEEVAKFKHYGHHVQSLITKAIEMEDGEKKQEFIRIIGSYMKLAFANWSREPYINDEVILEDLKTLSGGKLTLEPGKTLDYLSAAMQRRQMSHSNSRSGGRSGGRSNNHRNNNRGRGRNNSNNSRRHTRR